MTDSKPTVAKLLSGPKAIAAFAELLALDAGKDPQPPTRRPFQAPDLPPGVYRGVKHPLAMDNGCDTYGWLNTQGGAWCGLGFPGYPYLSNLAQRSEYRAPTEVIAGEMTREWINFTGVSDKKLEELEEAFKEFGVRECVRQCVQNDGFFGRGQMYVSIKGQDGDKHRRNPLVIDDKGATIQKGSLLGFKSVEPIWTTPYAYNSNNPLAPDFYKPEVWYVLSKPTHASRLLTFISRPLPDVLKPSYNFSGLSLSQLIEPYVQRWLKTVDSVNRLLSNFSVSGLMTNMQATLGDNGEGAPELFKRAALFNQMRDNRGLMLMDKDSEEFFQFNTPLGGLSELQAQAQEHMAAPTHIPLVKLTGITPSGLNASSDGEIKVFYDFIGSEQVNQLTPHMNTILRIVQLHLWGKVDPAIGFEWVPLDTPTDKEESEMRKADSDRDGTYVDKGVLDPNEVRKRLQNDPKSGYAFITGEAPEAPDLVAQQAGHELGEEGAENAHERGKDAAEHAAKLEAKAKPGKKD